MTLYLSSPSRTTRGRRRRSVTSIIAGILLASVTVLPVAADGPSGAWGAPVTVEAANTAAHDGCPIESPNGKQLFIASTRPGGAGKNDLWVAERQNKNAPWGPMVNLGAAINTGDHEFCPTPLGGGWLLFVSDRIACGATPGMNPPVGDIYLTRQHPDGTWLPPQHLGCVANGTGPNFVGGEFGPSLRETPIGTYLYFSSTGTSGNHDIYRSLLVNGSFAAPQPVAELNSGAVDQMPNLSADGTEIVFASSRGGNMDIYTATFDVFTGLWSTPVAVAIVNTGDPESRPSLSEDGKRLYFGRGATADIYVSTR